MSFSMKLSGGKAKKKTLSMTSTTGTKQYGLILPKKDAKKKELPAFNVFDSAAAKSAATNSAKEQESEARRRVGAEAARSLQQSQVERVRAQALAEDATVFDYDGVYDSMKSERESEAQKRAAKREAEKKQPKYISTLLQQAKIREVENERIRERRLLNERKADDTLYGDKEKLVSASYKRKLQEMQRWDAEDARLAALEEREDVTKQGENAMAGFYASLNKNIAMGGSTANARSAYTAKETRQDAPSSDDASTHRDVERQDGLSKSQDEPSPKKQRGGESPTRAQTSPARTASPEPKAASSSTNKVESAPATQKEKLEAPKPSKEDAIAAARARFLARKAQRKAGASSSG